ncbi:MAG: shikimate kinase [Candidatus Sumerlaeia bacterium]|nr:shikimate kinase [Candidatus Sumerlaeia bacterium]
MSQRCVVLVGMMGAGKSEVGGELADRLGYRYLDTDKLVEKQAGKPVHQIFSEDGEQAFRELETGAIAGLAGTQGAVIATGGGAYTNPVNRRILDALGLSVYLKASARELYARVKNDTRRPLLKVEDPKAEMARILAEREPHYKQAEITVDTEDLSVEEVVDELIDELAKRTLGDG